MRLQINRDQLLKPLQQVIGVVERRQTMPILANVLLQAQEGRLTLVATDLEVEVTASSETSIDEPGEISVSARKLYDICRMLPEQSQIRVTEEEGRVRLQAGRSRYLLSSLPAGEFPLVEDFATRQRLTITESGLRRLLERTQFSMAQQDVRYYLNGLLLEPRGEALRAVATDGHRLAISETWADCAELAGPGVIIPRKGVQELFRLLQESDDNLTLELSENHIRVAWGGQVFVSKLIDGRFPDYNRVIPGREGGRMLADRETLRQAMVRTAILSNERYKGIRLKLAPDTLEIQANNPEQEEAVEEIAVEYQGDSFEIGFNVGYLVDAISAVGSDGVILHFHDANSSVLIEGRGEENTRYVVMPMRL